MPFCYSENFQGAKRPVIPVAVNAVVVDVSESAIVGIAAIEAIVATLEIYLFPPNCTKDRFVLTKLSFVFYLTVPRLGGDPH